jgi:hypothetical protein
MVQHMYPPQPPLTMKQCMYNPSLIQNTRYVHNLNSMQLVCMAAAANVTLLLYAALVLCTAQAS